MVTRRAGSFAGCRGGRRAGGARHDGAAAGHRGPGRLGGAGWNGGTGRYGCGRGTDG